MSKQVENLEQSLKQCQNITEETTDTGVNEDASKTIIEDLIVAAHNSAKSQLKSKTTEEISKATGGFGIPGFKWPL